MIHSSNDMNNSIKKCPKCLRAARPIPKYGISETIMLPNIKRVKVLLFRIINEIKKSKLRPP